MDNDEGSNISEEEIIQTIKILVQDHEVYNIVGEDEFDLKRMRMQSGATISICDGSCIDRIIIVTGTTEEICDACKMIIDRLGPYFNNQNMDTADDPDSLLVKLAVPASQCGSLIGKGGSKIKEIRDNTGASMQVLPDMLPNSNERAVHITGNPESILDCIYEICCTLLMTPPKYNSMPYRPNNDMVEGPIVFSEGKAYSLQGDAAVPIADANFLLKNDLLQPFLGITNHADGAIVTRMLKSALSDKEYVTNEKKQNFQVAEMRVPDSCAGGIVGKNGVRLTEIRQISGAMVMVSNLNDGPSSEIKERLVTIRGSRESIALAKFLINVSIELQKTNHENQEQFEPIEIDPCTATLQNILSRPGAINIVANIAGYQNIPEFLTTFDPALRYS